MTQSLQFRLLYVLLLIIIFFVKENSGVTHRCIHDTIERMYPRSFISHLGSDSGESNRDKRVADDYLPYRMTPYYVMENITNSSTTIQWLNSSSGGFHLALDYFQSILSVIRAPHNLTIPPRCTNKTSDGQCISTETRMCGPHAKVPDEHLGTITVCDPTCSEVGGANIGVDTDYIYYITAVNDDHCVNGTLAYAKSCAFDDVNNRPLAGFINFCPEGLEAIDKTQSIYRLTLHETLHCLAFTVFDFMYFVDENNTKFNGATILTINGENVSAINSPKVLSYGREYYSCPDLQGVLLENQYENKFASSHWEARVLSYDIMAHFDADYEADYFSISNFTLHVLEDSGWYKVDYGVAETLHNYELLWGKGLGCNFVTANCDSWPYSCPTPGVDGCSYDYQATSRCASSDPDYYDGCLHFVPNPTGYCNSFQDTITNSCFPLMPSTGDVSSSCYGRQCYRHSSTQELFYTVTIPGDDVLLCLYDGATLTLGDGTVLTCPPAELTCSRDTTVTGFSSSSEIPPSWCDDSCATCSRPASPAHCLTCSGSLTLRGTDPSVCTTDSCGRGTFSDSSGNCVACAAGCRACTGPNNSDCLACEDDNLYRVTTDQPVSSSCVTADECDDTAISVFGDRTCVTAKPTRQAGGASSIRYHQFLLLLSLLIYSLYL